MFIVLFITVALWGVIATIRGITADGYRRVPECEARSAFLRR